MAFGQVVRSEAVQTSTPVGYDCIYTGDGGTLIVILRDERTDVQSTFSPAAGIFFECACREVVSAPANARGCFLS